jgi:hypothetical protein
LKIGELLAQQHRDFVEEFVSGHNIRFAISVYIRDGQPSKTKTRGKVLGILKRPGPVSIENGNRQ